MRIFAAGIATETNTFAPIPTSLEDFQVQRSGAATDGRVDYPSLDLRRTWGRFAQAQGCEFVFSLMAWAMPSGTTVRFAYEHLRDELVNDLRAALPVDIVLLNLHGAMVAEGYDDCEEDILRSVRAIVGPTCVIGVQLDLHCHLSASKLAAATIVMTCKEYPHTDVNDRARELFDLALRAHRKEVEPVMALFDCRMLGMYPTSREPLRTFVSSMMEAERRPGVLSVSFGHGFQFADVPHAGAKVLVVADADETLARAVAQELGQRIYAERGQIGFESLSLPLEQALGRALASVERPVVVADQSDNTGGGAPGDSTFALRWLLEHEAGDVGLAILHDPEVVRIAARAGTGATLQVRLGGKLGTTSGMPVDLTVQVGALRRSYVHALPQDRGEPWYFSVGDVVALRHGVDGNGHSGEGLSGGGGPYGLNRRGPARAAVRRDTQLDDHVDEVRGCGGAPHHGYTRSASRRALSILVLMRLRLSGDRYSTKTLPSRWSISCWMQTASRPSASTVRSWPSASSARTRIALARSTPS